MPYALILAGIGGLLFLAVKYSKKIKWSSQPASTTDYKVSVEPELHHDLYCSGLKLNIQNTSEKEIKIIWDESLYLKGSRSDGGFLLDKTLTGLKRDLPCVDVILPNGVFEKSLKAEAQFVPPTHRECCDRYGYNRPVQDTVRFDTLKMGKHGVYLVLEIGGERREEKAFFTMERET